MITESYQEYLIRKIEQGFTVKKESTDCYRVFNSKRKFYLVYYCDQWCLGETTNYREARYDVSMPKPVVFSK